MSGQTTFYSGPRTQSTYFVTLAAFDFSWPERFLSAYVKKEEGQQPRTKEGRMRKGSLECVCIVKSYDAFAFASKRKSQEPYILSREMCRKRRRACETNSSVDIFSRNLPWPCSKEADSSKTKEKKKEKEAVKRKL